MLLVLAGPALPAPGMADEAAVRPVTRGPAGYSADPGQKATAIGVTLDFARIETFEVPARTVIIGNPAIVDGTLSDEKTIVLTGKAVGTTNMIVLGEAGREIANLMVNVVPNRSQLTTVHQGEAQQTYTCADACRPLPSAAPSK
ncbi:pilus assembly protein N-terminal domain-containing protein [Microvirga sp. BT689]|uniref:pilus assembly protein N-terminal domain-containing protein n=1 Tax=Microvirga arvi TaxID=2778731 RepID=UPI00194F94C5|nr:pilus assembly protein N-terminal domain-containing protein [Microvirga arvi]MBM6583668.1 pilus assembly protein N-terminal domain-containing protein [Microvirga arvi]